MKNHLNNQCEQQSILSLLPYSENAQLVNKYQKLDDLYFLKSIVDFSIGALELFLTGNLSLFDAQVGENLCQIRAYKMITLSRKWLHSAATKNEFGKEIEQFKNFRVTLERTIFDWENSIKHSNAYNKSLDGKEGIFDFFSRHKLLFDLHDDFIFIILCCFLTHFNIRDKKIPVAINLEFISREFHISKYRSKRLTHKYQQVICSLGNNFIIKIADELPSESKFKDILPALYQISDENRSVLPCYIVSEIIFYHSIKMEVPILLIAHQLTEPNHYLNPNKAIYFLLTGKKDGRELVLSPSSNYLSQHCMVVSGEVHYKNDALEETPKEYVNRVLAAGPLKLILANTASHPQYSGKKLEAFKTNPFLLVAADHKLTKSVHENNLLTMQQFALGSGCSKHNQTFFFLRHIYANTVIDEIEHIKNSFAGLSFEADKLIN